MVVTLLLVLTTAPATPREMKKDKRFGDRTVTAKLSSNILAVAATPQHFLAKIASITKPAQVPISSGLHPQDLPVRHALIALSANLASLGAKPKPEK